MATILSVLLKFVVLVAFFICSCVKLTYSEDVAYSLFEGDAHLDSVISFNSHHTLHRRQSGNDNTTSSPTPTGGTTPEFTEQEVSQNHKYYTSTVLRGAADFNSYWDELYDVKHSEPLSGSHRVAVSVPINFNFRFYGHDVSKITIATGGFLYMSPFLHQWLTATQYIAPLMANFDTTLGNESQVLYKDFGHKFVVEWRDIFLQDQNHTEPFSFQTTLHSNGTIYFAYKQIPVEIQSIEKKNHPVKVGVSDAFYIDTIYAVKSQNGSQHRYSDSNEGVQRRTIYEYHRVEVDFTRIQSNSVVILEPLTTCNIAKDCFTCLSQDDNFDCKWCQKVRRCSDGIDWLRQEWRDQGCEIQAFDNPDKCYLYTTTLSPPPTNETTSNTTTETTTNTTTESTPIITTIKTYIPTTSTHKTTTSNPATQSTTATSQSSQASGQQDRNGCLPGSSRSNCSYRESQKGASNATIAGVVVAVLILVLLIVGGVWFFYAYTHPTSASGQWMINHRPSEMKAKMNKMKFWKRDTASGEKYRVESTA
ncbi:plexin domain-containing protein 2 isoform X2 [Magallana gigas]|uniref:plexin domain-containing protein 2 isoform X2 n=1 Tax=Magallana gigas TaxID=29159 RepID=UPI003341F778